MDHPSGAASVSDRRIDQVSPRRQAQPAAGRRDTLQKEMVGPGKLYPSQSRFFAEVARLIGEPYTQGEHRNRFIDALLAANSLWYPLRYPGEYHIKKGHPSTINKVIQYHYPTADDMAQINGPAQLPRFGGGSLYNDSFASSTRTRTTRCISGPAG